MNRHTKYFILCLFLNHSSFAINTSDSGVREIYHNLAKATLKNIITHLTYAEQVVISDIYPNLSSYQYNVTQPSTRVYAYLINNTGTTSTFTHWITSVTSTNNTSYTKNPYIYKLAIVEYGLKIQMQFVSNFIGSTTGYITSKLPIFEPFLGKKIILVPNLNITYSTTTTGTGKKKKTQTVVTGNGIDYWSCYTNIDESIASSQNSITEGNTSIVSIAGGVLEGCEYMTSTSLNSLWVNI